MVHDFTLAHGAYPAPLNYHGFPKSVCTSINQVICHGIPDHTVLVEGDIINVDVTPILNGYYGDSSRMFAIGNISPEAATLVRVARECLDLGIKQVKPGTTLGDIGSVIQRTGGSADWKGTETSTWGNDGTTQNLERDIEITGDGHIRFEDGSGKSTIRFVEIDLRPPQEVGKYPLHWHHVGNPLPPLCHADRRPISDA